MASIQNAGHWVKKHPVASFFSFIFFAIILALLALYFYDQKPWKVKDPSDPRFDASKFDPNDYRNGAEMAEVLQKLLKPGVTTVESLDELWCKRSPCGRLRTKEDLVDSNVAECLKPGLADKQAQLYLYLAGGKTSIFGAWDLWTVFTPTGRLINGCVRKVRIFPEGVAQ